MSIDACLKQKYAAARFYPEPVENISKLSDQILLRQFVDTYAYHKFSSEVLNGNRHVLNEDQRQFLDWVGHTARKRNMQLDPSKCFYRAQIGCNFAPNDQPFQALPYGKERMIPNPKFVGAGRVNSARRPVLYCADNASTAVAETRPWMGSWISMAEFINQSRLNVVDCSTSQSEWYYIRDQRKLKTDEDEIMTWVEIDRAFSTPITSSDDTHLYVPTQILAELFRSLGYDGIAFKSSVSSGINFAFFDAEQLSFKSSYVLSIETIKYKLNDIPF